MQQASEDEFNRALNIAFDNRLGLCKVESARQVFPLTGRYARSSLPRTVWCCWATPRIPFTRWRGRE